MQSIVSSDHMRMEPSSDDVKTSDEESGWRSKLDTARECPRNVCTRPPVMLHTLTAQQQKWETVPKIPNYICMHNCNPLSAKHDYTALQSQKAVSAYL